MSELRLDDIDIAIIRTMQENGRVTNAQLAQESGISPSAMLERVKRLETKKVIRGYTALVNPESLGKGTVAFVSVSLAVHHYRSIHHFSEAIEKLEEVLECYHVAGEYDFILKVVVEDLKAYEDFLINKLTRIEGINKIHSSFSLSTIKYKTIIPVGNGKGK